MCFGQAHPGQWLIYSWCHAVCPWSDDYRILNLWRASNPSKCWRIKGALSELHPNWIGIGESKLSIVYPSCITQLTGWQDVGYASSPSVQQVRGIICCWSVSRFRETSRVCYPRLITVKRRWISRYGHKGIICLYAPTDHFDRVSFFISDLVCFKVELSRDGEAMALILLLRT